MENKTALFEKQQVRKIWDEKNGKWWFSVVNVVAVLTDSNYKTSRKYWNKLKQRFRERGHELAPSCRQLKMESADGKKYLTDVADARVLFCLIRSIPSKKAEPFRAKLAKILAERREHT